MNKGGMPRKKIVYTHIYPYHIVARSNNKDNFYLPKEEVWKVVTKILNQASVKFEFLLHAFVLMDNHYHLLASASEKYDLGEVMCWIQKSVSRNINSKTGRINHVFGGPYRPTLIKNEFYYANTLKYIFQNPVKAGLVKRPEEYVYSSLINQEIHICSPLSGIAAELPREKLSFYSWINIPYDQVVNELLKKALQRTNFKISKQKSLGKEVGRSLL